MIVSINIIVDIVISEFSAAGNELARLKSKIWSSDFA